MTPKKITAILSLVLLAGGIALINETATAQEPAPPPATPRVYQAPDISLFVNGGTFLGVYAEDVNKENLSTYRQSQVRGVGITEIVKGSPAEKAGLKKGDVILRFDNEAVTSVRKLNRLVGESSPDQTARLSISRGGSEQEVSVTLGKRTENSDTFRMIAPGGEFGRINPQPMPRIEGFPGLNQNGDNNFFFNFGNNRRIGVSTQQLTKQLADYFGVKEGGVLITSVNEDSPAAKAGLRAGDIITAIDGENVAGSGDLSRAINKQKEGDVTLTVVRDKNQRTIRVTPTKAEAPMVLPGGRTLNRQVFRDSIRNSIVRGARNGNILIPAINFPTIPAVNIMTPQISLPTIPEINVVVPRIRVGRTRYAI